MKKLICFLLIGFHTLLAAQSSVVLSELKHPDVAEFSGRYNAKIREVWGIDSDITLVSKQVVDQIEYKHPADGVGPNKSTSDFLKRYSVTSGVVAVLQLQEFFVVTRRKPGVFGVLSGEAHGVLTIRFSYFDLASGREIQTSVVEASADRKLGKAWRAVDKTVNMSAVDRDIIINDLIEESIEKSYKSFRRVVTAWRENNLDSASERAAESVADSTGESQ